MKRSSMPPDAGDLLNLPLGRREPPNVPAPAGSRQERLPLEQPPPRDPRREEPSPAEQVIADRDATSVAPGQRLRAALLDAAAVAAVTTVAAIGSWLLGAQLGAHALAGLVAFALCFSFLYHVVPLAFWGQSPGMSAARIIARDSAGATLTLRQSLARWLGAVLTVVGLGLPLLLLRSGLTLGDRLSGSRVSSLAGRGRLA
jgi:hypothetical protein